MIPVWLLRFRRVIEILTDRGHGNFREKLHQRARAIAVSELVVPEYGRVAGYNHLQLRRQTAEQLGPRHPGVFPTLFSLGEVLCGWV